MPKWRNNKHQTPDIILSNCNQHVRNGDIEDAFATIYRYLKEKHRVSFRDDHETLMLLFVRLSAELKEVRKTRDGFIAFRQICNSNKYGHLDSLATCLKDWIDRAEEAGEKAVKTIFEEFEGQDLNDKRVEKEFKKKNFADPHLYFQWNVYRAVLDVLRNNQRLDAFYQDIVQKAIRFCVQLKRTTEFKQLRTVVKRHLENIFKEQSSQKNDNRVDMTSTATLGTYLNTRFILLEAACDLNLFQEAFKIIKEDIFELLVERSKATLDAALESRMYKKLALIFIRADKLLLHSYSILKYYSLAKESMEYAALMEQENERKKRKKEETPFGEVLTEDQLMQVGKQLVLATICSPIPRTRSETLGPPMKEEDKKNHKMAEIIRIYRRPNRDHLLRQLDLEDLFDISEDFKALRKLICEDFSPLDLCEKSMQYFDNICRNSPELRSYEPYLKQAVARKLVISVSKMYATIPMNILKDMFFSDWDDRRIESLVIEMVEENYIWCRMSHQQGMCRFRADERLERNSFINSYLQNLANTLQNLMTTVQTPNASHRAKMFEIIRKNQENDLPQIQGRVSQVHGVRKKDEDAARLRINLSKTKEKIAKQERQQEVAKEQQRLARDREEQNKRKQEEEQKKKKDALEEAKTNKNLKTVVSYLQKTAKNGKTILKEVKQINSALSVDEKREREKQLYKKMQEDEKQGKVNELKEKDYYVRACRREEIALLKDQKIQTRVYQNNEDEATFERLQQEYTEAIGELQQKHERKMKKKRLYSKCRTFTHYFDDRITARREEIYFRNKDIQLERKREHDDLRAQLRAQKEAMRTKQLVQKQRKQAAMEAASVENQRQAEPEENTNVAYGPSSKPEPEPVASGPGAEEEAPAARPQVPRSRPRPRPPVQEVKEEEPSSWRRQAPIEPQTRVQVDKTEASSWRRPAAAARPAASAAEQQPRRRFMNSSKKEEPKNTEAGASGPIRRSVRPGPAGTAENTAAPIRPTSPTKNYVPRYKRDTGSTGGASGPSVRTNVRPPPRSNVRPPPSNNVSPRSNIRGANVRRNVRGSNLRGSNVRPMGAGANTNGGSNNNLRGSAIRGANTMDRNAGEPRRGTQDGWRQSERAVQEAGSTTPTSERKERSFARPTGARRRTNRFVNSTKSQK